MPRNRSEEVLAIGSAVEYPRVEFPEGTRCEGTAYGSMYSSRCYHKPRYRSLGISYLGLRKDDPICGYHKASEVRQRRKDKELSETMEIYNYERDEIKKFLDKYNEALGLDIHFTQLYGRNQSRIMIDVSDLEKIMDKVRSNSEVTSQMLDYEVKPSTDFPGWLLLTCPKEDCGKMFVAHKDIMKPLERSRTNGDTFVIEGRSCPYCFRPSRVPRPRTRTRRKR